MQSNIEQKVMASVGAIYIGRKLVSATAIKLYVLAISLVGIASFVSVPHVVANLMQVGIGGLGTFAITAAVKTQMLVQAALLVAGIATISLGTEFFKANRTFSRDSFAA